MAIEASQKLPCFSPSSPVFVTRSEKKDDDDRDSILAQAETKSTQALETRINKKPRAWDFTISATMIQSRNIQLDSGERGDDEPITPSPHHLVICFTGLTASRSCE
ncbi:hypothetical protein YC2023_071556 [Brassica napus]